MDLLNTLIWGDCFDVFPFIADQSIDLILTDPPYNMTDAGYDCPIDLDRMWTNFNRIIKNTGIIAITGSQPFTTYLNYTNIKYFRYEWIWKKHKAGNYANYKIQPLKYHETVSIFYKERGIYNSQMIPRNNNRFDNVGKVGYVSTGFASGSDVYAGLKDSYKSDLTRYDPKWKYPSSILEIPMVVSNSYEKLDHPAQKPVKLYEHFINTYTNPDMVVLDAFAGSNTISEACLNTKRNYIAIEMDKDYVQMGLDRMKKYFNYAINIQKRRESFGKVFSIIKPLDRFHILKTKGDPICI